MAKVKGLPLGTNGSLQKRYARSTWQVSGGKTGMFAQNVAAIKNVAGEMEGISVPIAAIKSR